MRLRRQGARRQSLAGRRVVVAAGRHVVGRVRVEDRGEVLDLAAPDAELELAAAVALDPAVLADVHDRITWDAIIHTVDDVKKLPFPPKMINVKPSRAGGLRPLFELNRYCEEHGIQRYGGGQFELGVGRGQIQYLASIFHPDTPNDVAPGGYNLADPPPGLPDSPLEPRPSKIGFRWE